MKAELLFLLAFLLAAPPRIRGGDGEAAIRGFFAEAGGTLRLGWWMYQHGSAAGADGRYDLGVDNSHLSALTGLEAVAGWSSPRVRIGAGASCEWFHDYAMRRQAYTSFHVDRSYRIAERSVGLVHAFAQVQVVLVRHRRFALAPHLRAGWFEVYAEHPEPESLGPARWFGQLGADASWAFDGGWRIYLRPVVQEGVILPPDPVSAGHRHRFLTLGFHAGVRYTAGRRPAGS